MNFYKFFINMYPHRGRFCSRLEPSPTRIRIHVQFIQNKEYERKSVN